MTSVSTTQITAPQPAGGVEPARQRPRLRLKPQAPVTGYVDGAWWPRSRDLASELPTLLEVLGIRLGRIERVDYNLTAWSPPGRRISVGGRVVRLAGYRFQHPDTLDLLSARHRVTLLVVPPQTPAQAAHRTLMAAGHRANTDPISELLAPTVPTPASAGTPGGQDDAAAPSSERTTS